MKNPIRHWVREGVKQLIAQHDSKAACNDQPDKNELDSAV